MSEEVTTSNEKRSQFMRAVPELLKSSDFGDNPIIVRIASSDLVLSVRDGETNNLITKTYQLVNYDFVETNHITDGEAIKNGVIQITMNSEHFLPTED